MLKFCIIEDNLNSLNKLSHMLESIFINNDFDAEITYKAQCPHKLLSHISSNKINVFLIDIDLNSDLSGIEIAKYIRRINKSAYIIFITSHIEYTLVAFKLKTFDFLTKPLSYKCLNKTIKRLFDDINSCTKEFIKLDNKNTIIDQNEIQYLKRDGMKIVFHTPTRDYEIYSSFCKLQNKLPSNFVRCHKSFIANINNITKIEPLSNIIYFNDSCCDIGPKYKNNFMEVFSHNEHIR